jgi:hypothetical protein
LFEKSKLIFCYLCKSILAGLDKELGVNQSNSIENSHLAPASENNRLLAKILEPSETQVSA